MSVGEAEAADVGRRSGDVEAWFGPAFAKLHPRLQALHRHGGTLAGPITVGVGRGPGGWLGRWMLRRLGVDPAAGPHALTVDIHHDARGLRWARRFDGGREHVSLFQPHGRWPTGDWTEQAGPLQLRLDVDLAEGGWRWRPLQYRLFGVGMPAWLCPTIDAGKRVVDDAYEFDVRIAVPILGDLLDYGGRLRLLAGSDPAADV